MDHKPHPSDFLPISLSQELERRSRTAHEDLHSVVDRERAAAEERGKASVLLQAERDKGAMHEQLAFLKVQLQYALKVRGGQGGDA